MEAFFPSFAYSPNVLDDLPCSHEGQASIVSYNLGTSGLHFFAAPAPDLDIRIGLSKRSHERTPVCIT